MNSEMSALWSQASSESILDVIKNNFHTAKSGCGINFLLWAHHSTFQRPCMKGRHVMVVSETLGFWIAVIEILLNGVFHGSASQKHNNCCFFYLCHIERALGGCTARWHWDDSCRPSRFIIAKHVGVFIMWPRKTADKWLEVCRFN